MTPLTWLTTNGIVREPERFLLIERDLRSKARGHAPMKLKKIEHRISNKEFRMMKEFSAAILRYSTFLVRNSLFVASFSLIEMPRDEALDTLL